MKALTLAFATFVTLVTASVSVAFPAVNDHAKFSGTVQLEGQQYPMTLDLKLVAHDSAQNAYLQQTTQNVAGQTQSGSNWVAASDLLSSSVVQSILANCASQGGQAGTIQVKAGQFNTCAVRTNDSSENAIYWIGEAPFGIIKMISESKENGSVVTLELESFAHGK